MYNEKNTNPNDQEVTLTPEQNALLDKSISCIMDIQNILYQVPVLLDNDSWAIRDAYKAAAFLLSKASQYHDPSLVEYDSLVEAGIDEDIIRFASRIGVDRAWNALRGLTKKYDTRTFNLSILWSLQETTENPFDFPEGVLSLVESLLDVQDGESFCDLFCEDGRLTSSVREYCPDSEIYGVDVNPNAIAIAKIMSDYSGHHIHYQCGEIFALADESLIGGSFDKVFANYPFGLKRTNQRAMAQYWEREKTRIPSISRSTSSDWIYNLFMLRQIKETGMAVGIMTNGSTWNTIDTPIRNYFIENGFVQAVINLPAKLFPKMAVGTSVIIMSHGNNGVRMIDASNLFEVGRRVNTINDEHVQIILDSVRKDSSISRLVTLDELRQNDYILNSARYFSEQSIVEDGVPFENVIKRITRGAPLNAKQLDELSSPTSTGVQYLMLSNIQNGLIDSNLPCLKELDKKLEKYCLADHCLILSKNGYPYKVAVVEMEEGQKVLANGNLYVIEIDETKADPYYIAAFLNSEQGITALKRITVGAVLPNIGVDQLRRINIPLPDMEKQREIGRLYKDTRNEIYYLQLKIEKAKNRLGNLLEEVNDV